MSVLILPTCPTDCTGLPCVSFDPCSPDIHFGEVSKVYLAAADADDFTNVDLIGEWTTRLDPCATATGDEIRELTVIGELPEPEQTEVYISGDRYVKGFKTFSLTFEIDETNDTNYNWMLTNECNLSYKMWYETADGMLYGGNEGIPVTISANQLIPRERTDIVKIMCVAKWKSIFSPLRCVSPMA